MDRSNTRLTIKIAGKNMQGEPFQETAALESFGNFGALIFTPQQIRLGDLLHICGVDGEPLASAEVVWVRTGDMPALEVLLHRSLEPVQAFAMPAPTPTISAPPPVSASASSSIAAAPPSASFPAASADNSRDVTKSDTPAGNEMAFCPACNKPNPLQMKSCKYCGSYLTRSSGGVTRAAIEGAKQDPRSSAAIKSDSSTASSMSRRSRPSGATETTTPLPAKSIKEKAPANKSALESLKYSRKVATIAFIVLAIILTVIVAPLGVIKPTEVEVLVQPGCLDVNTVKSQTNTDDTKGLLDYWTLSDNGAVQFIRREDITAGQAAVEIDSIQKTGLKTRGCWCPRKETTTVKDSSQMPKTMASGWSLKPVGTNAATLGEVSIQWKDSKLYLAETVKQKTLSRNISKVIYYSGMNKLFVKLGDDTQASVDSPVLKELIFYVPSGQETITAAEGRLTNSAYQIYLAQPGSQQGNFPFSIRQVAAAVLALALLSLLIYLTINHSRIRAISS